MTKIQLNNNAAANHSSLELLRASTAYLDGDPMLEPGTLIKPA